MRIIVISDSHGRSSAIQQAINAQPSAKHVFFLGDVLSDIEDFEHFFPDRVLHAVRGNCDFYACAPTQGLVTLGGKKILFTHGHEQGVKGGTSSLLSYAKSLGADIALYGHTHTACTEYRDGIYLVNPGSVSRPRQGKCSYAVLDIVNRQVMPVIVAL